MQSVLRSVLARSCGPLAALAALVVASACDDTETKAHDGGSGDASAAHDAATDSGSMGEDDAGVAALDFTPSNFDPSKLDFSGIGDVDITDASCFINSQMEDSRCFDPSTVNFTVITQPNQVKVGIYVARSWRIEPNAKLSVAGSFPIILVATDSIDILGGLSAAAQGDQPVAGGYTQSQSATKGAGPGGGGAGSTTKAGGGASYCGIGGGGGIKSGSAASGGTAYGTPEMVPLVAGSQGGGGATTNGGAGGGAIQLVAGNSVSILSGAVVNLGGGHGNWSGGGGGSGGALLIEAHTVTVAGTIAANGGGGQGGSGGTPAGDAMASDQPAPGSGSYDSGAEGGNGSAASMINGSDGSDGSDTLIPGAGGGGAGRIRINTKSGSATLTGSTLSPDATTSCVTQGKLKH